MLNRLIMVKQNETISNTRCIFIRSCKPSQSDPAGRLQSRREIAAPPFINADFTTVNVTLNGAVGRMLVKYESFPTSHRKATEVFPAAISGCPKFSEVSCMSTFKLIVILSELSRRLGNPGPLPTSFLATDHKLIFSNVPFRKVLWRSELPRKSCFIIQLKCSFAIESGKDISSVRLTSSVA